MRGPQDNPTPVFSPNVRWLQVQNTDTEPVPPYGVMAITGVDDDTGVIQVGRPVRDGQTDVLFNGPVTIPIGMQGQAHQTFPAPAAYDEDPYTGADPQNNEIWGVQAGSWTLQKALPGFRVLGSPGDNKVTVIPMSRQYLGWVMVTSSVKVGLYYRGLEMVPIPEEQAWASYDSVWVYEPNGQTLCPQVYYLCYYAGYYQDGKKVYYTYCCPTCSSSSSSSSNSSASSGGTSSGAVSSASSGAPSSGTTGPGIQVTVVTDIQCVGGQLQVTKMCLTLPAGSSITPGECSSSSAGG